MKMEEDFFFFFFSLEMDLEVAVLGVKACLQQIQVTLESHWDSEVCSVCHRDFDVLPEIYQYLLNDSQ